MGRIQHHCFKLAATFAVIAGFGASAASALGAPAPAALPPEQVEFFENKVRPLLAERCYSCHSAEAKSVKGDFRLDTREGVLKGGVSGKPSVVPGNAGASPLIVAVKWADENLKMPPKAEHRLSAQQVADLEAWVQMGAPDPRLGPPGAATLARPDAGSHWAFQKPKDPPVPQAKAADWAKSPVDHFILQKLEQKDLSPSPIADKRTLIRRATFDLTGLPPTPEEIAAFEADASPDAFAKVIDRLLASPHYGERWGRYWLDIARYADTKGYVFEEERRFPFSYTYRDWVIRAFNEDLPYDQFVTQQIAADRLPLGDDKRPLAAMGFLTIGRRFLNNQPDIIDDRIDVVTRGTMALTVQCARCHDHKYDPIPIDDYYSLYGVFSSSEEPREQPIIGTAEKTAKYEAFEKELAKRRAEVDAFLKKQHAELVPKIRTADGIKGYLAALYEFEHQGEKDRMDERRFSSARELSGFVLGRWRSFLNGRKEKHDPVFAPWLAYAGIPPAEFAAKAKETTERVVDNAPADKPVHPLVAEKFKGKPPASIAEVAQRYGELLAAFDKPEKLPDAQHEALRLVLHGDGAPTNIAVTDADKLLRRDTRNTLRDLQKKVEAFQANNPDAPPRAMVLVDDSTPRNARVFLRGNPANPGKEVPRQFLSVLAGDKREPFKDGSGRLELAKSIASPDNPLTARVMVNRVWTWHFGAGLVRTPSDFGLRSDPPTHPELLDYLAHRFIENGWSVKKLHKLIMLSSAYQQASDHNDVAYAADPENTLLWRSNRRRLEFEALRDSVLAVTGKLDRALGGRPVDITGDSSVARRTVYGFIDRQNLPGMFRSFDFASPDTHSPQRFTTTVPQQALFMMNSPFVVNQAKALAARPEVAQQPEPSKRVETMYRLLFGRGPTPDELWAAAEFIRGEEAHQSPGTPSPLSPWERYAQVLLQSNEFVFVD